MTAPAPPFRFRAWLIDLAIWSGILTLAFVGRGWYLASLIGGYYPLWALAIDVGGLLAFIVVLRFFDLGSLLLFARAFPERPQVREVVRFGLVFAVVGPFFITLAQMHPQRVANSVTPGSVGLPYTDVTFTTRDGVTLHGWFLPAADDRPVLLVTHGIGGNRQNFLPITQMLHGLGYAVLTFDFRAHGDSGGMISTLGAREVDDVLAAVAWLRTHHPARPIYGVGYSMGGAALVGAEKTEPIFAKLILDSTYARAENVGRQAMRKFYLPDPVITGWWHLTCGWAWVIGGGLQLDRLRPEEQVAHVPNRPLFIIHGANDRTTPAADALRLWQATGERARLWQVPDADHLGSANHPDYRARVQEFLAE